MTVKLNFDKLRFFKNRIIVTDMQFGEEKLKSGLIIQDDDGTSRGIKPRWAKVIAIGPEQKDVKIGQYILLAHGRWTRAIKVLIDNKETKIFMADTNGILAISDAKPLELETVGL